MFDLVFSKDRILLALTDISESLSQGSPQIVAMGDTHPFEINLISLNKLQRHLDINVNLNQCKRQIKK